MSGAVLNALNIRLDAPLIGRLLEHAESKIVLVDSEFAPLLHEAMEHSGVRPYVVTVDDSEAEAGDASLGDESFDHFIAGGAADHD